MLLLALGGVVLGFAFLILSLLTDNAAWAWACIGVCLLAGVVLVLDVVRRRRPGRAGPGAAPGSAEHAGDVPVEPRAEPARVDQSDSVERGAAASDDRGDGPTGQAPTQQIPAVRDDRVSAAALLEGPSAVSSRDDTADARTGSAAGGASDVEPDVEDQTSQEGPGAATSDAEVLVVDERPRFHVAGCAWLAGRESIPLPAREAVELGFSPCAVCRPVAALTRA